MIRRFLIAAFCALLSTPLLAQTYNGVTVQPQPKSTVNASVTITAGNTFQIALAANTSGTRQQLVLENNNATDKCWFYLGSGTATTANSAVLLAGGSMTFAGPVMPNDQIQVTCASTSDTFWIIWN
jgi:hypothetical protein